jgi:flavin reductase (DIM6/NTAB) family NADH-FMN oxidoreductase RutF
MVFDTQTFKNIMSHWASGIAIITTGSPQGDYHGFTANSLASVSIEPMLVSMSMAKTLSTADAVLRNGVFTVNMLSDQQVYHAKVFAGMVPEVTHRFDGLQYTIGGNGCPLFAGVIGYLECRIFQTIDVGASTLVLGEVTNGAFTDDAQPLLYFHRQWGVFTPQP